ncbi:cell division protein kinase [Blumeria hordei DH14]|uniref:cyclin-dependent kinase n=1 Tax=Blumeria graminis f. sp. hordei (strain DH14) TaxID=546991 RepID=N1J8U0_BLUG1|nr:cell division protein kinase [Blumeria hordei DH14]
MDQDDGNWRNGIKVLERYENVQRITKRLELKAAEFNQSPQERAFEVENTAYKASQSRDAYNSACNAYAELSRPISNLLRVETEPDSPGIDIGNYQGCHHISSGLCSDVYRCNAVALKVILQLHNVEPHNPELEVKILSSLNHPSIIKLNTVFRDPSNRLILVFPYQAFTLATFLAAGPLPPGSIARWFCDIFSALKYLHAQGIIHRDIKPSNVLIASDTAPALLSDFGTAWHPAFSASFESPTSKCLEVGTTSYRAPETLFGHRGYSTPLDLWATGAMLAECLRNPPKCLFDSRNTTETGNQLGLILSMFQTLGTPTRETWPEASTFNTPPFDWYKEFPAKDWKTILVNVEESGIDLVRRLLVWESGKRLTAIEVS